ncbi:hypothetical protein SKAU_G00050800 [Synaphobranchus kaupii]|uniref:Uncharacterized protein n=1 Tax=Synaphobranchus kaupii TaxID=118154 RepID=A0A9Q1G347_SYNKA|nr:hypothetical protein SKAU_G00050800 [Synaphobranchus kaupii]
MRKSRRYSALPRAFESERGCWRKGFAANPTLSVTGTHTRLLLDYVLPPSPGLWAWQHSLQLGDKDTRNSGGNNSLKFTPTRQTRVTRSHKLNYNSHQRPGLRFQERAVHWTSQPKRYLR